MSGPDILAVSPEQMTEVAAGGAQVPRRRRSKGNGTEQATGLAHKRTRPEFTILFNGARRKTVEGYIEQGKILIEAEEELDHGEYEKFADEVVGSATGRKLKKIARHRVLANRSHVNDLPASLTTLYELSFLKPETLLALIDDGTVNPKITREQAHALRSPPAEPVRHQCALCADTARVPEGHHWDAHDEGPVEIDIEDQDETADLVEDLVAEIGRIFGPPRGSKPTLRQKIERVRDERVHPDIRAMLARALREHAEIATRLADELAPAPIERRTRATRS